MLVFYGLSISITSKRYWSFRCAGGIYGYKTREAALKEELLGKVKPKGGKLDDFDEEKKGPTETPTPGK